MNLLAEDFTDQITPVKGRKLPVTLKTLLKPFGDGSEVAFVAWFADGLHVHYSGGKRLVFRPTEYSGRVKDGPTSGTFVADLPS